MLCGIKASIKGDIMRGTFILVMAVGLTVLVITSSIAFAHGGGLNSQGCHNNRKTGDYHCHRAPAAPTGGAQSALPLLSADSQLATPNKAETKVHQIMAAQTALSALGYKIGPVDGKFGGKTTQALATFQASIGAEATGVMDDATLYLLVQALAENRSCD